MSLTRDFLSVSHFSINCASLEYDFDYQNSNFHVIQLFQLKNFNPGEGIFKFKPRTGVYYIKNDV